MEKYDVISLLVMVVMLAVFVIATIIHVAPPLKIKNLFARKSKTVSSQ